MPNAQENQQNFEIRFTSEITVRRIMSCGGDSHIASAARVEEPDVTLEKSINNWKEDNKKSTEGIINYMMKHRHGCYDEKTEVLTRQGWKKWKDTSDLDEFVTLNIETNKVEYQRPYRLIKKEYNGPMIKINSLCTDILVTPDHRMLSAPRVSGEYNYSFNPASSFLKRSHRIKMAEGSVDGTSYDPKICKLIGFIVADGNYNNGYVSFHLRKERKIRWLTSNYPISSNADKYYLKGSNEVVNLAMKTYTKDGQRCFPKEILNNGDANSIKSMLDGYLFGDGSVTSKGRVTCSTVSRQLVNDIQEACAKIGKCAVETSPDTKRVGAFGTNPVYRLTIYNKRNAQPRIGWTRKDRDKQVNIVQYSGTVYCATVPNGTLYVRRNGKPLWCGNSPFEHGSLTLYVHAPIFVWREWHRHRIGFSYNEQSARYSVLEPVFYVPPRDRPMMKVENWKPARPKFMTLDEYYNNEIEESKLETMPKDVCVRANANETHSQLLRNLQESYKLGYQKYQENLALGVDPGLARDCLPVGIYSACWISCNPRSIMAFLSLRTFNADAMFLSYPLYEIDIAAQKLEEIFKQQWPITYKAFNDNKRVAP